MILTGPTVKWIMPLACRFRYFQITALLLVVSCSPFQASEVYYKRDALYNFLEEGFLAPDILQTAGSSIMRSSDGQLHEMRQACLNRAAEMAHDRMVSIMLHTRFHIPGGSKNEKGDFRQDYPHIFSDREILLGSIDFADLLNRSFLAFQDFSENGCQVSLRLIESDLSKKIRQRPMSFRPAL
jgi:hypothetical protein